MLTTSKNRGGSLRGCIIKKTATTATQNKRHPKRFLPVTFMMNYQKFFGVRSSLQRHWPCHPLKQMRFHRFRSKTIRSGLSGSCLMLHPGGKPVGKGSSSSSRAKRRSSKTRTKPRCSSRSAFSAASLRRDGASSMYRSRTVQRCVRSRSSSTSKFSFWSLLINSSNKRSVCLARVARTSSTDRSCHCSRVSPISPPMRRKRFSRRTLQGPETSYSVMAPATYIMMPKASMAGQ
jgi:hypothetical protein